MSFATLSRAPAGSRRNPPSLSRILQAVPPARPHPRRPSLTRPRCFHATVRRPLNPPIYTLQKYAERAPPTPDASPRDPRVVFSAIQPTGIPHLGNYLGALVQWRQLQEDAIPGDQLLFAIADLHALTTHPDPALLERRTWQGMASMLAVGLTPQEGGGAAEVGLFIQNQHIRRLELMWILSCISSMGHLSRMTQWKSKTAQAAAVANSPKSPKRSKDVQSLRAVKHITPPKTSDTIQPLSPKSVPHPDAMAEAPQSAIDNDLTLIPDGLSEAARSEHKLGLFSYPVLQAADILVHGATHVPVGEDQAQHLEFARDLAASFNARHAPNGPPILLPPQTLISPAKRVRSLAEPDRKMSKSHPSGRSRILITDSPTVVRHKIRHAVTDSVPGPITYDAQHRPGVANLLDVLTWMYELKLRRDGRRCEFAELRADVVAWAAGMNLGLLKHAVADAVSEELRPVRARFEWVTKTREGRAAMVETAERGREMAGRSVAATMGRVREAVGLVKEESASAERIEEVLRVRYKPDGTEEDD